MITRVRPRHARACGCGHACHQRGPYQPVRWCVRCLQPIRRGHKYRRTTVGAYEHKQCRYPTASVTPEEYRAAHGEEMYRAMAPLIFGRGVA